MKLGTSGSRFEANEKVLSASFKILQLIAKSKKSHTIGENLLKPCLLTAVEEILGAEAKKKIQEIPLSNNTVKDRIDKMSFDIEEQLLLLVFVRFLDNNNLIKEELLLLQELSTTSKGSDILKIINDYFEKHDIMWEKLAGFCTDGAPAMLGSRSGLATLVKEKNRKVLTTHCIIHRQALVSKTLPEELQYTLKQAIKLVNIIKTSALNTRIFKKICSDLDSEYETLLFHTEVRWLSKEGSGNNKLEGSANISIFEDKLRAFMCKIDLWISKVEMNNYSAFQTLKSLVDNEKYADLVNEVQQNVLQHLKKLKNEFNRYFPEYNDLETNGIRSMIRNPFIIKINEVPDNNQEDLIELQNDRNCKDTFESGMNIEEFWCKKAITYPKLREIALRYLVMFSTTYLCEQGFSGLLYIKNKQRNLLDPAKDLRVALSSINPRISLLVNEMQAQKSH
ncbi:protein ZBED8-like [Sipha flava]|uniref:Protein ZBED8-like n=1 Tax=Sipha flava TaxID=143950 RepID=A0A8B8F6Y8_9HEMI|nr:protein ZBED8-like [Sipha flava]